MPQHRIASLGLGRRLTGVLLALAVLLGGLGLHPEVGCHDHETPGAGLILGGDTAGDDHDWCVSCDCVGSAAVVVPDCDLMVSGGRCWRLETPAPTGRIDDVVYEIDPPPVRAA